MSRRYAIIFVVFIVIIMAIGLYFQRNFRGDNTPCPLGVVWATIKDDYFKENSNIKLDEETKGLKEIDPKIEAKWNRCIGNIRRKLANTKEIPNLHKITNEAVVVFNHICVLNLEKIGRYISLSDLINEDFLQRIKDVGKIHAIIVESINISFLSSEVRTNPINLIISHEIQNVSEIKDEMLKVYLKPSRNAMDCILIHPTYLICSFSVDAGRIKKFPRKEVLNVNVSNDHNTIKLFSLITYRLHLIVFCKGNLWAVVIRDEKENYRTNSEEKLQEIWENWDICYILWRRNENIENYQLKDLVHSQLDNPTRFI